jgi:hypothetical protein
MTATLRTNWLFQVACLVLVCELTDAADGQTKSGDREARATAVAVIAQAPDRSVQMLAKGATTHGTTVRYEPQPHKNTLGYWTNVDDWVSWDFQIQQPGTFDVELTQACSKSSAGSEYTITIDKTVIRDKVPSTGAFTNFIQRIVGQVTLSSTGRYTVSVKPVSKPGLAVMDLRAVTLKPKPQSE